MIILGSLTPLDAQAFSETVVHSFVPSPYGQEPESALIQASDGNLYGTTMVGGTYYAGTIFRIQNLAGSPTQSVIYNFTGGSDGLSPQAALLQASDGNLYGTASRGGTGGAGTVFRISNLQGVPAFNVIYDFTGGSDGGEPVASLIEGSDGKLYGTTEYGGAQGTGTVYAIANFSSAPVETVVYSFASGADGVTPTTPVIQATDGNLYGTTYTGGASDNGTVFKITGLDGVPLESVIYNFMGGADGGLPSASLLQASDGSLYGTASNGGAGYGTVFRIGNLSGPPSFTVVYSFAAGNDGGYPSAPLIQASDGNLYGTTFSAGPSGVGTVFVVSNFSGSPTETVLYAFIGAPDGANPNAAVVQASDGSLYGTASYGGATNAGTVFRIGNLSGLPTFNLTYQFSSDNGSEPFASVIQGSDGNLYGTTYYSGAPVFTGHGTVFRINGLSGTPGFSVLHRFSGGLGGSNPYAPLLQAADGNLYGTTSDGSGPGNVFQIGNLAGLPSFNNIHHFYAGANDGSEPLAGVIQATDGNLYGTTMAGGTSYAGTVYAIGNLGGTPTESLVYSFAGGSDGLYPSAAVIQASDGNLYGTTHGGGGTLGTVFRIENLGGVPTESIINSFLGGNDGQYPYASLIQASDGNLYGTTYQGGATGYGTVFKISNLSGVPTESVIHAFSGGADGASPYASLLQGSDGNLYGTTLYGGTVNAGTVFMIGNLSGVPTESVVYSFTGGVDGGNPGAALIEAADGNLYGTTGYGGIAGFGTVFALVKPCFGDVPAASPFRSFICTIARDGITAGCGAGNFCPADSVLRSQMAVFLLRGEHGSAYVPPPAVGIFADVPASDPFAPWIEELYNEQITGGCGTNPLNYCPSDPVTRASMAVLLLAAQHGTGFVPPACAGIFADVACPGAFTDWIEALYGAGITGGCSTNPLTYCPAVSVTRAQMAVSLVATFSLQ